MSMKNGRPTVAFLGDTLTYSYSVDIWRGVSKRAAEHDINLLCFAGGIFRYPNRPRDELNRPYDLFNPEQVDGVIFLSAMMTAWLGLDQALQWCASLPSLPRVSIGLEIEGIPSITVDNHAGMYAAVSHLIEVHGKRRIAFVRGPAGHPEAEARYQGYADALTAHGLTVEADLVAPGGFTPPDGVTAASSLLDERKVEFDAIVTANDNAGLGALEALRARGVRIPAEVALVGFDDYEEVKRIPPPFTTVRQPTEEIGRLAVDIVAAALRGEEPPMHTRLPAELIVRQSCGCPPRVVEIVGRTNAGGETLWGPGAAPSLSPDELAQQREHVLSAMMQVVEIGMGEGDSGAPRREWAERLFEAVLEELKQSCGFLPKLNDLLQEIILSDGEVMPWQGAIAALEAATRPYLLSAAGEAERARIESLWMQARAVIAEAARLQQAFRSFQVERRLVALYGAGAALITSLDMDQLTRILLNSVRELGIPSAYLTLYEEAGETPETATRARLAFACDGNNLLTVEGEAACLSALALIPDELWPRDRRYSYVVERLEFGGRPLGVVLFEMGPTDGSMYDVLRHDLSSAVYSVLLLRERRQAEGALAQAYAEIERQVQERTAELEREVAERERAQAELLNLQQEVIEAQKQALRELSTPVIPVLEGVIVMPLVGSIDTLRARDILRAMMAGIREHRAEIVILDITGVQIVDSGVAGYLNRAIQAARLKGARTIVTGISEAVAETIVDLGIDWSGVETLADLQSGLFVALQSLKLELRRH